MNLILLIALFIPLWVHPQHLRAPMFNPGEQGYANQQNQDPIIDEIYDACGPLFFQSGAAEFNNGDQDCLYEVYLNARLASNYYVIIDGHRDSSERKAVSLIRAKKARDKLVKDYRINAARVIVRDFSDTCPYETGEKSFNGRVVFRYWREDREVKSIPNRCAPGSAPKFRVVK